MKRFIYRFGYLVLLLYWHVFRPHTKGVVLMIINNGKVLLVRHSYKKGLKLVGGTPKKGEDLKDAMVREFNEELGVVLSKSSIVKFGEYLNTSEGKIDTVTLMISNEIVDAEKIRIDGAEIIDFGFYNINSLPENVCKKDLNRIKDYVTGKKPVYGKLTTW